MYQELYNKAKTTIKEDACMKIYSEHESLYLETVISGNRSQSSVTPGTGWGSLLTSKVPYSTVL